MMSAVLYLSLMGLMLSQLKKIIIIIKFQCEAQKDFSYIISLSLSKCVWVCEYANVYQSSCLHPEHVFL